MKENALKCKYNGGTLPIGYVIDENKNFRLDTLVAPVVLDAFKRYDEGYTVRESYKNASQQKIYRRVHIP